MKIPKKLNITFITISLSLVSILLLFGLLKTPIFRFILSQKVNSIEKKYKLDISYSEASIKGINTILVDSLSVLLKKDSACLFISNIKVTIPFKNIIKLDLSPSQVDIGDILISYKQGEKIKGNSIDEEIYSDGFSVEKPRSTFKINPIRFYQLIRTIDHFSKTDILVESLHLEYFNRGHLISAGLRDLMVSKGSFSSEVIISNSDTSSSVYIQSNSHNDNKLINFKIFGSNNQQVDLPIIDQIIGLSIKFDTLNFSFSGDAASRDSISFQFNVFANKMDLNHNQLSDTVVKIDYAELKLFSFITPKRVVVDSISSVKINRIEVPFGVELNANESVWLKVSSSIDSLNSKELFESIPGYLFPTLEGIKVSGFAKYRFNLDIDFNEVDSLHFSSKLTPLDFKIESFGRIDFTKLNDSITHKILINDSTSKLIILHKDQPYFRSLENISPHLINAVIVSEDGGFFSHKGFDASGFSYALAQNIKSRQLTRGGSTITMQLVKNLYLNRSKTIARKAEESIIVWLIETQKLLEKERILEIYLNIIEWGPNIYGITEASEFYFNKEPHLLKLNEAIFLASIIPRPNQFFKSFDNEGNLREYYEKYYKFVSETMLERNFISIEDIENLTPNITLTGPAKHYIEVESGIAVDSSLLENTNPEDL